MANQNGWRSKADAFADGFAQGEARGRKEERSRSKHQGWSSYETWCVALWINNEQGSYEYWRQAAKEERQHCKEQGGDEIAALAQSMKDEYEENMPDVGDLGPTVWSDLLSAALSEVNWYELAKSRFEE